MNEREIKSEYDQIPSCCLECHTSLHAYHQCLKITIPHILPCFGIIKLFCFLQDNRWKVPYHIEFLRLLISLSICSYVFKTFFFLSNKLHIFFAQFFVFLTGVLVYSSYQSLVSFRHYKYLLSFSSVVNFAQGVLLLVEIPNTDVNQLVIFAYILCLCFLCFKKFSPFQVTEIFSVFPSFNFIILPCTF